MFKSRRPDSRKLMTRNSFGSERVRCDLLAFVVCVPIVCQPMSGAKIDRVGRLKIARKQNRIIEAQAGNVNLPTCAIEQNTYSDGSPTSARGGLGGEKIGELRIC